MVATIWAVAGRYSSQPLSTPICLIRLGGDPIRMDTLISKRKPEANKIVFSLPRRNPLGIGKERCTIRLKEVRDEHANCAEGDRQRQYH